MSVFFLYIKELLNLVSTFKMEGDKIMKLRMVGTSEKTPSSRYKVMLVDHSNTDIHPIDRPKWDRFFEKIEDRNAFIHAFEQSIFQAGGNIVHRKSLSHYYFEMFEIYDNEGNKAVLKFLGVILI